jgi:hypothetical protein
VALLRNLLVSAARRIAANPEVQARAAETYDSEVKPRIAAARDEFSDIAAQVDPVKEPLAFARRVRERIRDVNKGG